tara:strand:+ start:9858 stop:10649 length:792 start_codon:yes stop_codon:yes gene_type:complete
MDESVVEAINDYYLLKNKYNTQINNQKKRISANKNLSLKDKRIKFKGIKFKCINCNKIGGTIFTNKNNILSAGCGSNESCNLNINIDRGSYTNIYNTEILIKNDIEDIKKKIMTLKLDLLFNYSNENTIIKEFKKQKKDLSDLTKSLFSIRKEYLSIVDNEDANNVLETANYQLLEYKQQLTELIENFENTKKNIYISEMVEIYNRDLKPIISDIQNSKYKHMELYDNVKENKYNLFQNKYNYSDLYIPINNANEAKIINNTQ